MVVDLMDGCPCGYDTRGYDAKCRGKYYGGGRMAAIKMDESYDSLMARVKNGKRDARYADRVGCYTEQFDWASWLPDVHDINHSKDVRCGGPMRGAYNDDLESMAQAIGGIPPEVREPQPVRCPHHWRINFGIFAPVDGEVMSGKKLVGYVGLLRVGNLASYTQILGHGDWLKHGIMFRLHFDIMRWAMSGPDEMRGVDVVHYLDFYPPSLAVWKRKAGFEELYW